MGKSKKMNFQVKGIPSNIQKRKKIINVKPKLIKVWTFLENKNKYLGTLTFEKMDPLFNKDVIPWVVASLK